MSENKFETVSSCVDDFQHDDNAFDDIINDEHLSTTWDRYHLIGDVLRNDTPDVLQLDLSAEIAQAIAAEPTILAPKNNNVFALKLKAKVVAFAKPFGQLAIAASAAGLMVLGVQSNVAQNNETILPSQIVKTIPMAGTAEPVSLNFQEPDRASQKQAFIDQQRRFHALFSDHQQQVKLSSLAVNDTNTDDQNETHSIVDKKVNESNK
ncbi:MULTISPECIES: sigma-E factor negative regulatory protein [unclassified Colwellia]|jgi:sigma-E factor negative regulatory protein RseA|uniref:sigma-E factor negative regulatory protein n=1 Tax=unclassified Colwellia TaxID=196834 RepID=UPI0015F374E9|nr:MULTISPECIES: RseA family anti-sigma factor [unclassified Colwellia]MBA6256920.1 transcriptional regulator [Colwellia sp. MB3u-28]MBA6261074.1 transcriptional regulator [Colwellia sp. MB3u-41]MBA6264201.1 transcriptional regulator [Colwellia sp. Bg11-12]MBA6303951.1 transcriptional regulator [Colwellia sp. MB02u-14]